MEWRALITRQAGAVTVAQLRAYGLTEGAWRAHLDAGRWQRVLPRVLVTFTGPIPPPTRRWAALLYAGSGAVLSHRTAGELWGLVAGYDPVTHVSVTESRRVRHQPQVVIHRSRLPLAPHGEPPRTTAVRTVLDLAGSATRPEQAAATVLDATRSRIATSAELRDALLVEPNQRWRPICLDAVAAAAAGVQTALERLYHHGVERAHGLPHGELQARAGKTWRDIYYRRFRTTVELDGRRGHDQALERWRDQRRDNAAAVRGEMPLRFGWFDVRFRPCEVAAQVAVVLTAGGWDGSPRRCGTTCSVST